MKRRWKDVPLEVSSDGLLRLYGRVLTTRSHTRGYEGVTLALHRLIALTFHEIPGDPKSLVVHHIDGDTRNNVASNLEWLTQSENCRRISLGINRKLSDKQIAEIRLRRPKEQKMIKDLAREFGVSAGAARAARRGRTFSGKASSNRAKLTPGQVQRLRNWSPPSPTALEVGLVFSVSQSTIRNIWKTAE